MAYPSLWDYVRRLQDLLDVAIAEGITTSDVLERFRESASKTVGTEDMSYLDFPEIEKPGAFQYRQAFDLLKEVVQEDREVDHGELKQHLLEVLDAAISKARFLEAEFERIGEERGAIGRWSCCRVKVLPSLQQEPSKTFEELQPAEYDDILCLVCNDRTDLRTAEGWVSDWQEQIAKEANCVRGFRPPHIVVVCEGIEAPAKRRLEDKKVLVVDRSDAHLDSENIDALVRKAMACEYDSLASGRLADFASLMPDAVSGQDETHPESPVLAVYNRRPAHVESGALNAWYKWLQGGNYDHDV